MDAKYSHWLIIFIALLFFSFSVEAAETLILDPQHTFVLWRIKHFGFSTQAGKWYASGILVLDKEKPQNSKVSAVIQMANVMTGIPELDKHLRGKLFFDSDQYPTATYISHQVTFVSKNSAKVFGTLTLHGVAKEVVLAVTLNEVGTNPITDRPTVGFSASTKINRADFNINTLLPGLANEVVLDIEAEAYQPIK